MKVRLSPYLAALWAVAVVLAGVWVVDRAEQQKFFESNRALALKQLSAVRAKLEAGINSRLSLTRGLVAFVSTYWDIDTPDFESFAKVIAARQTGIDSIYLAKNTAVSHIYPQKGKEAELGRNLVGEPQEGKAIQQSINTKKTWLAGPLKSERGQLQIASLAPIFLTDFAKAAETGDYWGIAGMRIDLNTLLKEAGVLEPGASLQYALRGKDGLGSSEKVFFGEEAIFQQEPVLLEVSMPGGSWQIGAIPGGGGQRKRQIPCRCAPAARCWRCSPAWWCFTGSPKSRSCAKQPSGRLWRFARRKPNIRNWWKTPTASYCEWTARAGLPFLTSSPSSFLATLKLKYSAKKPWEQLCRRATALATTWWQLCGTA